MKKKASTGQARPRQAKARIKGARPFTFGMNTGGGIVRYITYPEKADEADGFGIEKKRPSN